MEDHHLCHSATIRLLCHTATTGRVIGNSGFFIKHLQRVTGATIRIQDVIPNCHEQVINVTGYTNPERRIYLNGERWNVSPVQVGLVRVFERILAVEKNEGGRMVGCRLLAGLGQVGGVIGAGGSVIAMIQKRCGSKISILPPAQLPQCAVPGDELIQIMGKAVAVKKSLVAVAWRLQVTLQAEGTPMGISSYKAFPSKFTDHSSLVRPLSAGNDRNILTSHEDSYRRKVEFRLLCSSDTACSNLVKTLEEETGASISFSDSVAIHKERIVSISSLECPESLYSPAQIAVMHVFTRCIEVGARRITGNNIAARLLVSANEVSCLIDIEGKISSDIGYATGVNMQLLGANLITTYAAKNDYVVQIVGLYDNVKTALFRVTSRLRDDLFSNIVPDGVEPRHNAYSAHRNSSPYEREKAASPGSGHLLGLSHIDHENALKQKMDQLGFLEKPVKREDMTSVADNAQDLATSEGVQWGVEPAVLTNSTEEFEIPEQVFHCVYGENGSNLARIKQISGALIKVEDPRPSKSYGKVIISGTLGRIKIARSLLQAFILPEL